MASRLVQIAGRRRALVARSEALRMQLIYSAHSLHHALRPVQIGHTLLSTVRGHPGIIAGAIVALISLRITRLRKLVALGGRSLGFALHALPVMTKALRVGRQFGARQARR